MRIGLSRPLHLTVACFFLAATFASTGCSSTDDTTDAYGNFEADDVIISSEVAGRVVRFDLEEGDDISQGILVAVIDTTQLVLQMRQLKASQRAVRARTPGVVAQIEVLEEQRRVATIERDRISNLVERKAATQKQLDDIEGQLSVLERQIRSIRSQNAPILAEVEVLDAQIAQVENNIQKSHVINPLRGTVLTKYVNTHEVTATGKPLYRIAPVDTLILRAYVSGAQLSDVVIGKRVQVLIDDDGSLREMFGRVSWISDEAEFTPKLIQTRDERVNLVYAFKVRVPNPTGAIKVGMPGEVRFDASTD